MCLQIRNAPDPPAINAATMASHSARLCEGALVTATKEGGGATGRGSGAGGLTAGVGEDALAGATRVLRAWTISSSDGGISERGVATPTVAGCGSAGVGSSPQLRLSVCCRIVLSLGASTAGVHTAVAGGSMGARAAGEGFRTRGGGVAGLGVAGLADNGTPRSGRLARPLGWTSLFECCSSGGGSGGMTVGLLRFV